MKRRFPYKILLSACLSAALVLGPAAYAYASSPVIPPLEESSVASMGSGGNSGPSGQNGGGPSSGSGQAAQGTAPGQGTTGSQGTAPGPGTTPGQGPASGTGGPSDPSASQSQSAGQTAGQPSHTAVEEPVIAGEVAALLNASTGKLLFSKNGDTKF